MFRHDKINRTKLGLGAFCNSYIEKHNFKNEKENIQTAQYILKKNNSQECIEYSKPKNLEYNKDTDEYQIFISECTENLNKLFKYEYNECKKYYFR